MVTKMEKLFQEWKTANKAQLVNFTGKEKYLNVSLQLYKTIYMLTKF